MTAGISEAVGQRSCLKAGEGYVPDNVTKCPILCTRIVLKKSETKKGGKVEYLVSKKVLN